MRRAVIAGAGPNGLVCAIRLAGAGFEVTVLEHAPEGNGGLTTIEGPLPGYWHDLCAAFFPLALVSPAFRTIPLEEVSWIVPDTVMAHPFLDGSAIALERGVPETAASLDAVAPGAGAAWTRFVTPLVREHQVLADSVLGPFPPVRPVVQAIGRLRLDAARLALRGLLPAASLGLDLFRDQRAAAWLSGSTAHADLDPGHAGGGAFAIFLQMLGHAVGWPLPRGGARAVADALAARLAALGGHVRHASPVEEVLVRGGRATGVRTAAGERIDADLVVATVNALRLPELLPAGSLPRGVTARLRRWRHEMGTFKVDFALSGPVRWTAEECRRAGVVHIGDTLDALFRAFRPARAGRFPEEPALVIGQQSLFDGSRAPDGRHTLYAYARSPLRMDIPADDAADRVERRIEQFAPGFRKLVLARAVRTPEAIELHDPTMVGGDLGGGSYRLDQQLFLRPHPRLCRTRTPIRGLYLASASVHPGGGVHAAQGMNAARAALADLG
jgi:phytoene dehydrogenase-like protein